MPSIVQIIVPASSLQIQQTVANETVEETTTLSTTTTTATVTSTVASVEVANETESTTSSSSEQVTSEEPLRSSVPVSQPDQSTTVLPEPEKDDEIDDILQLNEDIDSSDDYQDNDKEIKKQRDRSDFRYVESFESEKSILQKFEPDPSENDTELKNGINESYQPSVLPVPKALSSSKDSENEDHEPPEVLPDQNISAPEM